MTDGSRYFDTSVSAAVALVKSQSEAQTRAVADLEHFGVAAGLLLNSGKTDPQSKSRVL